MENDIFLEQDKALNLCFENIKPSVIGKKDYDKLRSYKQRYFDGTLKQNGIETILHYFGYQKAELWFLPIAQSDQQSTEQSIEQSIEPLQ